MQDSEIYPEQRSQHPHRFAALCDLYQKVAGENGRNLGLGQGIGCLLSVHFGMTEAEAANESEEMRHAVEKHYRREQGEARTQPART